MLEQLDLQPGHRVLEIGADFIMYEPDLENQTEKVYFIDNATKKLVGVSLV